MNVKFLFFSYLLRSTVALLGDAKPTTGFLTLPPTRSTPTFLSMVSLDDAETPRSLVSKGMEAFRNGDVKGSISYFDKADAKVPDGKLTPFLWQRGLSYYYDDRFEDASKQFRIDVNVNPLDVEEIVWDIASLSRLNPSDGPPKSMMSLPPGRSDRRRIMVRVLA